MKNKRLLKNALLILVGLLIIALYLYDKRSSKTIEADRNQSETSVSSTSTQDLSAPTSPQGTIKNPGEIPGPVSN
jgi:hypothetical protein